MDITALKQLESDLWEAADRLRAGSKLNSNQYCMPVLGLLFLRYAFGRFKRVEKEILAARPMRNGRTLPVEASDFLSKNALYLPREAQYDFLVALPENLRVSGLTYEDGHFINSLGEAINYAMELVERQSSQLQGVLPRTYTEFPESLLRELLRIFNNDALSQVGGDAMGRIYEYFLNKFAKNVAQDYGVFFTPKSLVKMIVNVLEPRRGILLDPACGSGGMFVQTGDFIEHAGGSAANLSMTFYGQEKVDYNAKLCLMNMAVHGLSGSVRSGDEANTFYHDAHNLEGKCDYVMANPPFNVDRVKAESAEAAGRLPFGLPAVNKEKEVSNGNYLWISYFYAYLNKTGRAGFVMPSSSTDSQGKDKEIRQKLVETGHVDVMVAVGNNFFYTKSLPCTLWFFDKGKKETLKDKVLFLDARNYYTQVDRTLNEWTDWQLKNLNAVVWLYRGQTDKYKALQQEYRDVLRTYASMKNDEKWNAALSDTLSLAETVDALTAFIDQQHTVAKSEIDTARTKEQAEKEQRKADKAALEAVKGDKEAVKKLKAEIKARKASDDTTKKAKDLEVQWHKTFAFYDEVHTVAKEALWLFEKFGDGTYKDIPGLCKIASRKDIAEKNFSLTPGAYVGVVAQETDGVDFNARMKAIHTELKSLQATSNALMTTICENFAELVK